MTWVRVEFVIPAATVLLSDFDAWHIVLMQGYLALTEHEDETWRERAQTAVGDAFPRYEALPPELQAEARLSWERIFDRAALESSPLWYADEADARPIQAVVEEVCMDQVVSVTPFVAR